MDGSVAYSGPQFVSIEMLTGAVLVVIGPSRNC